jgi:hypothetical protein
MARPTYGIDVVTLTHAVMLAVAILVIGALLMPELVTLVSPAGR